MIFFCRDKGAFLICTDIPERQQSSLACRLITATDLYPLSAPGVAHSTLRADSPPYRLHIAKHLLLVTQVQQQCTHHKHVGMFNVSAGLMVQTIMLMVDKQNLSTEATSFTAASQNHGETQRCYGPYGCFSITEPWVTETRPIGLFPDPPEVMNVKFPVFSRRNLNIPLVLDPTKPERIAAAKISPRGPFYVISHGYLESGDKIWIQKMAEALLLQEGNYAATVIVVDWRGGSKPPYTQSVANIRLVGTITAHLLHSIYEHLKLENLDNFHFIGHSLGAHLAGYAGYTLQHDFGLTLGRITGMDPAEPHFAKVENIVRLEKTDAKYVDIIHTDASPFISGGLGISESIGHVDFYPNGGSNQPGCNQGMFGYGSSIIDGIRKFLSCNHVRSYEFFTETIAPSCPFLAIRCSSYEEFLKGSCFKCGKDNHHCIPFGYHSQIGYNRVIENGGAIVPMNFYLVTGDKQPFCRVHYRITLGLSSSEESSTHGGEVGRLWIIMIYPNGNKSDKIPLDEEGRKYHKPGSERTQVISTRDSGFPPKSVLLEWEYETNLLNPLTWRILSSPRIYVSWLEVDSLEYGSNTQFCPHLDSPVVANLPNHFQPQYCNHPKRTNG